MNNRDLLENLLHNYESDLKNLYKQHRGNFQDSFLRDPTWLHREQSQIMERYLEKPTARQSKVADTYWAFLNEVTPFVISSNSKSSYLTRVVFGMLGCMVGASIVIFKEELPLMLSAPAGALVSIGILEVTRYIR